MTKYFKKSYKNSKPHHVNNDSKYLRVAHLTWTNMSTKHITTMTRLTRYWPDVNT